MNQAPALTLLSVTPHLFNNNAFWENMGSAGDCTAYAFGRLNRLLCTSRTMQSDLLEDKKKKYKKRGGGSVFDVLFREPESILYRAVHTMFAYRPEMSFTTSLSRGAASRRFSIPSKQISLIYSKAKTDETSESHHAARLFDRVTVPTLIQAVLDNKGGFHRIKVTAANRMKARAKARKEFIPIAKAVLDNWFLPLLDEARPFISSSGKKKSKNPSKGRVLVDKNYRRLNTETQCLLCACESKTNLLDRKIMSSWLSAGKKYARGLERALFPITGKKYSWL